MFEVNDENLEIDKKAFLDFFEPLIDMVNLMKRDSTMTPYDNTMVPHIEDYFEKLPESERKIPTRELDYNHFWPCKEQKGPPHTEQISQDPPKDYQWAWDA